MNFEIVYKEKFDMISSWEYTLNQKVRNMEEKLMTLDSILAKLTKKQNRFNLNQNYKAIRHIEKKEYEQDVYKYVEPEFVESYSRINVTPRFILFSAPGATGKTALAKHICYTRNGIYWDLPENKIAEYSFQGAITEAVGFENVSGFMQSIVDGSNFLVIDAFDEAEAGSGRSGIEFFLRDLNNVTRSSLNTCAILLARTESAIFIKDFLNRNEIPYSHYEVGNFAEYNSKTYVKNKIERCGIEISSVVDECIEEQFKEIHRIFSNEGASDFLGYAPVLDALAASYNKEKNTVNLLKATTNGEKNCTLIVKILDDLLEREQTKFIKALKNKFAKNKIEIVWEQLYKKEEQLYRIIGMLLFDDSTMFSEISKEIPVDYYDEYLEVVNTQLPQHPFICVRDLNSKMKYDFTGPAFKDYVIAYGLAEENTSEFVNELLAANAKYCPSQLLIEFFELFSGGKVKGEQISLMYNSFKAHANLGDASSLYISGDTKECYVEFVLTRDGKKNLEIEFSITNIDEGIYISQLSDCYIDVAGKIYIGSATGEARINNSVIICDELVWSSEQILIEAYSPGNCILTAIKFNNAAPSVNPRFEIKTDNKANLRVSAKNLGNYYKLLGYKDEGKIEQDYSNFEGFSYIIRRIFSCLRSHSKDTPARKMDFIDNRIINRNEKRKSILSFLLEEEILYTDEQDWLYKLDTDKLSKFGIMWNNVKNGDFSSLQNLYSRYSDNKETEGVRPH